MNNKCVLPFLTLVAFLGAPGNSAFAKFVSIENNTLKVSYFEGSGNFWVTDKSSNQDFVKQGKLEDCAGEGRVESTTDKVFGSGKRVTVKRAHGGQMHLELYKDLPFVLVRGELHNKNLEELDITHLNPVTFSADLARPVAELCTMGTAGLTAPDKNPGSYLFLTLAEPATRRGLVAGWLTHERGGGVLFSGVDQETVTIKTQLDYGHLRLGPGESATLETLAIGIFADARLGEEQFADALARQYHIQLRPPMAGYCTWYSNPHGGASDEQAIIELARFAERELKPFGFSFIQIDDKWQDGIERNGPARRFWRAKPDGPYPHGMRPTAEQLKSLGFMAGIWFLPFASDYQDSEFKTRQDWFVKRKDGKPYETDWGNTSLDLTRPEVQGYLSDVVRTIRGWGYNYFKMDGLWTGSASAQIYVNDGYRDDHLGDNQPFHDPKQTNLEVFRNGLKLLRRVAGPEVFFSGCNVSQNMRTLGGCVGLVDSMRIGPDNGQGWADYRQEISSSACGSLITGPIRGTRLYFLNGRVWWNDPDPSYVRATIPLEQARLITSWVALSGQFYLNSDWLPELPPERVNLIQRTIPAHRATARPVDYFDSIMPQIWLVNEPEQKTEHHILGLFNWDSTNKTVNCASEKAGLNGGKTYYAFDFWENKPAPGFQSGFSYEVPAQSCRVLAVQPATDHPVLVSTSRHVTQGIIDLKEVNWSGRRDKLSGRSAVVGKDPYELRLAGLNDGRGGWKLEEVTVSDFDKMYGVKIEAQPGQSGEEGWLRVVIKSPDTREVKWAIKFSKK